MSYHVRTAADRERLDALLAAGVAEPGNSPAGEAEGGGAADLKLRARTGGPTVERIEISGPPGALAGLAAALEAAQDEDRGGSTETREKASADAASRAVHAAAAPPTDPAAAAEILLVIEVIDETATGAGEGRP